MTQTLRLSDPAGPADLDTFLGRAAAVQDGAARLIAGGGVLAVYVSVLHPVGLLDDAATVLGLRTIALAESDSTIDEVVPISSLRSRLRVTNAGAFGVPAPVYSVTWAGIVPPRGGWVRHEKAILGQRLMDIAEVGIAKVAEMLPENPGEPVLRRARQEVWNDPISGFEALIGGAAFAAVALGFAVDSEEECAVFEVGPWARLSLQRGHVLVKRRAWSLAR